MYWPTKLEKFSNNRKSLYGVWKPNTAWKEFVFGFFLVCISPYTDWIRTRKLRIRTLFTQCNAVITNTYSANTYSTVSEAASNFKKINLKFYCNIQIFVIDNVFSEYCSKQQILKRLKLGDLNIDELRPC